MRVFTVFIISNIILLFRPTLGKTLYLSSHSHLKKLSANKLLKVTTSKFASEIKECH